jgi:hypothetical protein
MCFVKKWRVGAGGVTVNILEDIVLAKLISATCGHIILNFFSLFQFLLIRFINSLTRHFKKCFSNVSVVQKQKALLYQ